MRILHIAHTDTLGGAARAAYRLHTALRTAGVDSRMLVGWKRSDDPSVYAWGTRTEHRLRAYSDRLLTMLAGGRWSSSWSNNRIPRRPYRFADGWAPEIVNLHWVWGGFARLQDLHLWSVPHAWTMHDMAALTGGCHYAGSCMRLTQRCGACPQLGSRHEADRSTAIQAQRIEFARRLRPVVVAPSRWMAGEASRSAAYRAAKVVVIPYGLRFDGFRPLDRRESRSALGLEPEGRVIAFGAVGATSDPRKGYDLLLAALAHLAAKVPTDSVRILVFGGAKPGVHCVHGFECHEVGTLKTEERLAQAYSAADVFVAPSREDNLPNTLIEALACGTPGVGFAIGGIPEIVAQGETGWLAPAYDPYALAVSLEISLEHAGDLELRRACRRRAETDFPESLQTTRYQGLYRNMINGAQG